MAWELDGQTAAVEEALAGGTPQRAGWFRFYFEDQRWEWSDSVYRMHGYEPGTVTPTTELVIAHKHPADRNQVAATINDMVEHRQAFSTRHRIVDTRGNTHDVVVVGDQFCDSNGEVIGTHGFYVDVTPARSRKREESISEQVAEIAERRGAIDRTKGMLMLVYGVDELAAFNLLKSLSQVRNMKLGALAEQIAKDFSELGREVITSRSRFDQRLLTAHDRAFGADN
ncbi:MULTISPECIES: PAS and ANTAR domain-containing protein [unclassified Mycobacterium]|uniref:PAS and ANTAR domain-containing protein n=1 Tax=unclassified Mycobacterium TaxID=2642494 RepID=UPI00080136C8|nr:MULTISPECIES: PAS and ANTAR domain-containing protein [unclassified Mycobacterium]OBG62987.1 antitermination regulator [Mycobacterium sp. E188]OBG65959.1 antitermination regulator [Mycobacterium sp. E735]OBG69500.1 antitermination regulator [Mycobacterium sp. E3298]OBG75798.1 antitermination regulator [Mycobacterium sp. E3305]OBH28134.1 antitermination regulator [Mycobacterium sp. E1715]